MSQCFIVLNSRLINWVLVCLKNLNVWVLPSLANGLQYNKLSKVCPPTLTFGWKGKERLTVNFHLCNMVVLIIRSGTCLEDMKKEVNDRLRHYENSSNT